jgi:hypothetical protein
MKLDINEINHQYIYKVVLFAIFLFKRQIRQPTIYKMSVIKFVNKRIPWKINLNIITPQKLAVDEEREILLNEILDGIESDYMSIVEVSFKTPLKSVSLTIDLKDEKKYEQFLYK